MVLFLAVTMRLKSFDYASNPPSIPLYRTIQAYSPSRATKRFDHFAGFILDLWTNVREIRAHYACHSFVEPNLNIWTFTVDFLN